MPQDFPALEQLYVAIFPDKGAVARDIERIFFDEPALIYVAEEQHCFKGFFYSWLIGTELQILDFGVDVSVRRQGIGKQFLEFVIKQAYDKHCKTIVLEVRADNKAALNLYQKFGFAVNGTRHGYYSDGCDGILMEKLLNTR
jgi:ribosomal-protein-alanine N-acetyltransferase